MTDADKIMHPQHFGTDPTDIRINPKIRIRTRDHFQLKFWRWWRFALSEFPICNFLHAKIIFTRNHHRGNAIPAGHVQNHLSDSDEILCC